eukprot:357426-Chlamydomonas_euryale.AAC.4
MVEVRRRVGVGQDNRRARHVLVAGARSATSEAARLVVQHARVERGQAQRQRCVRGRQPRQELTG